MSREYRGPALSPRMRERTCDAACAAKSGCRT
jgi:hypothetical protein